MKLYLTAAGIYAGTQAEAKADGKGWVPEEVPTDKQGLIDYLNNLKFGRNLAAADGSTLVEDMEHAVETLKQADDVVLVTERRSVLGAADGSRLEPSDIEDFILNRASVAQVEQIFARLGTRFKELAKA